MSVRRLLLVVPLLVLVLVLVVAVLQLLAPGETIRQGGPDGASILFGADHQAVIAPGGCVVLTWQVDLIQTVFVNGTPVVGAGQQRVCVGDTEMPVLRVVFRDGSTVDYHLNVEFLVEQPATWLLLGAALILSVASVVLAWSRPERMDTAARGQTPRATAIFSVIGSTLVAVVVTLFLLETGMRFYFSYFGTELEKIAYVDMREQIDALTSRTIPLPFVEYGLSPRYSGHNQLGYRGDEIQVPKPPGVYRIVALGGSTTYGTAVKVDETYPYFLQQVLRDDYGYKNVEVVNGGVAGYTSWNVLVDLALRVPALQPDLVIFYEATNDVIPREVPPDCYSAPSPFLGLDPQRTLRAAPEELSASTLYRFVAIKLGWMKNPAYQEGEFVNSPVGCGGQEQSDVAQNVAANRPIYFERNERTMAAIAQADGFRMMFAGWAYDHNSPDALPFWRTAVDEHNAITRQVAQDTGALYLDYAAVAPVMDDSFWSDYIHMDAKGDLDQARAFAKFLVDQGVIVGQAAADHW